MSTTETENGVVSQYVPFTPFQESYAFEPESSTPTLLESAPARTPFVSEYAGVATQSPQSADYPGALVAYLQAAVHHLAVLAVAQAQQTEQLSAEVASLRAGLEALQPKVQ